MQIAPYGTWQSSITAEHLAANGITFFDTVGDGDFIYNVEMRPQENGRHVIVRYAHDGSKTDVLPAPYSARTRVHEYGGRAFTVHNDTVFFVNYADQNLYKIKPGCQPEMLTKNGVRFAEPTMIDRGLLAVAEQHIPNQEAKNFIALINPFTGEMQTLVSGADFYAFPTPNHDGSKLAWVSWQHPNMPWDTTELWVADLGANGITNSTQILTNSVDQSFFQPGWDEKNNLIFVSDRGNWWNIYILQQKTSHVYPLCSMKAEFAKPLWNLGIKTWGFLDNERIFCLVSENGVSKAMVINKNSDKKYINLPLPFTSFDRLCIHDGHAYFVAGAATIAPVLVSCNKDGIIKILSTSSSISLPKNAISMAQHIEFPTESHQEISRAYYYPPTNPEFIAPEGSKPPLIVFVHGGPTSAAYSGFSMEKQFWTSRGFAVADVNYGGSAGYGRAYRSALHRDSIDQPGYWGEVDIKDCVACVKYLVEKGLADPNKVVTRGRSAGGYTTLALLAFTDVFKAGASYYGVSDMLALAHDTHKFESRYLDQLVGELPKFTTIYKQRSPIEHLDKFTAPLLVLQGDEDKVVPVSQAEKMVNALKERGVRVEYKLYPGEQHGFRQAATLIDALNRELAFYLSVFYPEQKKSLNNERPRMTIM